LLYRKDVALNNLENCHSNVYFGVKNAASTPVAGIASKAASCALSYKARTALDEFIINDLFTGRVIELFYLFLYLAYHFLAIELFLSIVNVSCSPGTPKLIMFQVLADLQLLTKLHSIGNQGLGSKLFWQKIHLRTTIMIMVNNVTVYTHLSKISFNMVTSRTVRLQIYMNLKTKQLRTSL